MKPRAAQPLGDRVRMKTFLPSGRCSCPPRRTAVVPCALPPEPPGAGGEAAGPWMGQEGERRGPSLPRRDLVP